MARTDRPQPLTLNDVRELAKAPWEEPCNNEQILKEDPGEYGRMALARIEEIDDFVRHFTHGRWTSLLEWLGHMQIEIWQHRKTLLPVHASMIKHGIWKREHCANYYDDLCYA